MPHLVFGEGPTAMAELARLGWRPDPDADRVGPYALALGALTPAELRRLESALEELADRLEGELAPVPLRLEEGKPWDAVLAEVTGLLPTLNASTQLGRRHARAADGSFGSTVVDQCPRSASLACSAVWVEPGGDHAADRARFFHWPLSQGAVLDFRDADTARRALGALREAASRPDTRLGLVVTERDLAGEGGAEVVPVRRQARRALEALRRLGRHRNEADPRRLRQLEEKLLLPLATDPAPGRRLPWLRLAPADVLVVPKMGGLVSRDFVGEIERVLGSALLAHARWIHRPRPLGDG
jgi:hypothetical protein